MTKDETKIGALGLVIGLITSSICGAWYISGAIADEGRAARNEAQRLVTNARNEAVELIAQQRADVAEVYARREDLRVLETKLDAMLVMQQEILRRMREESR